MASSEPFENPLVPNARLRQMLLAMHRARAVEQALPLRKRAGANGLEACLVAPAVDLGGEDLISDALDGPAIDFLRGAALSTALQSGGRSRKRPVLANAGSAQRLVFSSRPEDRLWMAIGGATALQVSAGGGESDQSETRRGALLCYLRAGQVAPPSLSRAFQFASAHRLPILFVALPTSLKDSGAGVSALGRAAARAGIPAIAADHTDAVAIYRVAQESFGRARAGGGPALIECVPFLLRGLSRAGQTADALAVIEDYVLARHIATPEWIARESRMFARHLARPLH